MTDIKPPVAFNRRHQEQLGVEAQGEALGAALKLLRAGAFLEVGADEQSACAAYTLGRMIGREYGLTDADIEGAVGRYRIEAQRRVMSWNDMGV